MGNENVPQNENSSKNSSNKKFVRKICWKKIRRKIRQKNSTEKIVGKRKITHFWQEQSRFLESPIVRKRPASLKRQQSGRGGGQKLPILR